MLKFAVVHSPAGPGKGPGLDHTDQVPNIERSHQYTGAEKYESFFPYGGGGADHIDGSNAKLEEKDENVKKNNKKKNRKPSGVKVKKGPKRRACIGIDFDGTITADPDKFRKIINAARDSGATCHLVTGRPKEESDYVKGFCKSYGLEFESMNFYPVAYKYDPATWDMMMDSRIGVWKGEVLNYLSADIHVDDNMIQLSEISKKMPGIKLFTPVEE